MHFQTKVMFKYIRQSLTAIAIGACVSSSVAVVLPPYRNPAGNEFPIVGWYSIPDSASTPERYAEMRQAGFNISFPHLADNDQVERAVEASRGSGVRLIVMSGDVAEDPEGTARRFRGEPQIAAWYICDEPVASQFADLAALRDRLYAADSSRMVYVNLFPNILPASTLGTKDYDDYMRKYIHTVRPEMLSYDHYPVIADDSIHIVVRPEFFGNLESARRISEEEGLPFWGFCLSTPHAHYPVPRFSHMYLEAFSALAYGAQGIQHFTYWEPLTEPGLFYHGPIDATGQRTDTYYMLRHLNKEIQNLAPVFLGSRVHGVWHTGDSIPEGTQRLIDLPSGVKSVNADGCGVGVSRLTGGDGMEYLMLINRDIDHAQKVCMEFDMPVSVVGPDYTCRSMEKCEYIAPGAYLLIRMG